MSVEAVPRRPHDRVASAIERERLGALQTSRRVKADGRRWTGKRFGRVRPLIE
jgi:hypothetical protein